MSDSERSSAAVPAYSAKAKTKAVLRVLRGEDLDAVALDAGVPAQRLAGWKRRFVGGGSARLARSSRSKWWRKWPWLRKNGVQILQWAGILLLLALTVRVLVRFVEPSGE